MERELGAGYSFERKPCFVCGSLSHLIKDCDYYEKKMAREAAFKSTRVVHANVRQATPAWTNSNRVNKANQFTPRPVQLNNIRPNLSTASKTIKTGRVNVNTGHGNVSSVSSAGTQFKSGASRFNTGKQHVSSGRVNRPVSNNTSPKPSQVNLNSPKKCFSKQRSLVNRPFSRNTAHKSNIYAVKGKMGTAVKTSAGCVWRKAIPLSNTNSGPTPDSNVNVSRGPQGRPKPVKAWLEGYLPRVSKMTTLVLLVRRESNTRPLVKPRLTVMSSGLLMTVQEAVNTACYTFNRVRVTKPQNKTPYELLFGHKPILSYIRPFGCHVTILNTLSPLGKFDEKSDEGFLVGYSVNSKAFRVYNLVTKRVEVNLHVNFLEEKPNVQGIGHRWMFDLDYLTDSMNYIPVSLQNQANPAGSKEVIDIDEQTEEAADLMVVSSTSLKEATRKAAVSEKIATKKTHSSKQPSSTPISKSAEDIMTFRKELDALALKHLGPVPATAPTSTNPVNTGSINLNTAFEEVNTGNTEAISPSADHEEEVFSDADDDEMPEIRIYDKSSEGIFEKASYDDDGIISDFNNLPDEVDVPTNHTLRIHNAHPQSQSWIPNTTVQTRSSLKKITEAHALEELLQFKLQQVWVLVVYPMELRSSKPREAIFSIQRQVVAEILKNLLCECQCCHHSLETKLPLTKDEVNSNRTSISMLLDGSSSTQGKQTWDYGEIQNRWLSFLGQRLNLLENAEKQTNCSPSTTEAEYVAAAKLQSMNEKGGVARYALTANPTIYDSLVKQFWQSAIASTKEDGFLEISATIDTIRYTISEASIRESLQLDDATGITMLPNDDLFQGMGQIGYPTDGTFTFWKSFFTPQWRYLVHHLLHCISSKSGGWDQFGSNIATALICLSTDEYLYEKHSPVHHHFSPSQEQAPSRMPMDDLLHTVPKLISRIDSLELDLKQTKLTMGNAIVKLVKKVKKLEGFLKRRNLVLTDSEDEEPEAQGRKSQADPQDSSIQGLVTPPTTKAQASGEEQEEDISPNTLEAAKTLSKVASLKSRSIDKGRRYKRRKETKGKKVVSSLDFQEDNTGAEKINTAGEINAASIEVNTASKVNTGSIDWKLNTVIEHRRTAGKIKAKRRESFLMLSEETLKKTRNRSYRRSLAMQKHKIGFLTKREEAEAKYIWMLF
ncbi:ribonuclease H-like domain-containing protein [Tanacetum coccineum]